ncbi:DUF4394 domain-containing protein [Filimonas effusa]|uniref:DUF4394 domain-containing protein n=1 Tax=Filimonas effusa TaxID=2508721 RepID=A0A4Q1DE04_9BACT|nr:DUF4394 domain-containing protein [Filimonas effusa]RXK86819.1 DUF4394 domain-containing protein [Filimonas effusa]
MNAKSVITLAVFSVLLCLGITLLSSCSKSDNNNNHGPDITFWGLTNNNQLIQLNARNAGTTLATINVTGLATNEKLLSIDFRPATGQLYALSSNSRLYIIDIYNNKGNVTAVGSTSFTPMLSGTSASIDFNPTVDRIRLVSNTGQNLRLHPETGAVAGVDGNINGGTSPAISSIAYTNNIAGASATELFDIDANTRKLYKQNPPNDGTLAEVGTLNVNFSGKGGFDINSDNSVILASFVADGMSRLYTINTANAQANLIGNLSTTLIDIAIPTDPVAYSVSESGQLQIFNPSKSISVTNKTIAGLGAGETVMGIDFRPVNGQLYGVAVTIAGNARLYTFNLATGAAAAVGSSFLLTAGTSAVGFDFNPTVDRIRLVTNLGQNLRLVPDNGTIAGTDGAINPGSPAISGAAYTNNYPGATTTTLFVLNTNKLFKQDPPNNGLLTEIGNLGITADSQNGFDIGGASNMGYAVLSIGSNSKLYTINTTTGMATASKDFPNKVSGFAIAPGF